jgi:predicted phosphodiesterase
MTDSITRSGFIKGGAAAFMLPSVLRADERPRLRFGVISDIHITRTKRSADHVFRPALEWFRDQGVDAVVCTGDLATTGMLVELKNVSEAWYSVFPDDKLPDGRRVEKVFLYGNHDTSPTVERYSVRAGRQEEFKRASILTDRARAWEICFREKFEPIYIKRVKGYAFVAAHWEGITPSVSGVPEYIEAHKAELAGDRPFFYCQHAPLRGTVNPYSGHFDDGAVTKVRNSFPNACAITGHSHTPLTDETSIWQGAFTALCGAACANSGRRYAKPWFENSDLPGNGDKAYPGRKGSQMPVLATERDGGQGLLVDVYGDRVVLHRRSFVFNEPCGPDWILPLPLGSEKPFRIDARRDASEPPEFAAGSAVKLEERDGMNREKEPTRQLIVSFPTASKGTRPFGYEVTVGSDDPGVAPVTKYVLSPDFHLPPTRLVRRVECVFAVCDVPPPGRRRVKVTPFNSLRKRGTPLVDRADMVQYQPSKNGEEVV